jgi:predicted ATP-grasp superfamily ATP-dependent carboligase
MEKLPLAFPDIDTVLKLADKGRLMQTASQIGVPVPKTHYYKNINELDKKSLTFPFVLKPCLSKILTIDGWISTSVRIIKDAESLTSYLESDLYLNTSPFMIQEFIPGHGAGVFCLYDKGEPIQFFAHQRLREKPPEGGVSVLSQAASVDPILKDYATRLLSNVGWHGVAMVEFRIHENGTPYLMEVNTRFWGSLQLAIDSGVDFPTLLTKLHFGEDVIPVTKYNTKQRLRWFLGDIDSLYIFLKRPNSLSAKIKRVFQFCLPRFTNQKHEVNRLSDFRPFLEELKQYFNLGRE